MRLITVMLEWMPHVVPGQRAHRWTWGDYEIVPVEVEGRPFGSRYEVRKGGRALLGEPVCLGRARQRAEKDARDDEQAG